MDLRIALPANISVRGRPATAGSRALAGFTAVEDATVVRRLRQAGASLLASREMSEFGLGPGPGAGAGLESRPADGRGDRAAVTQAADVELMLDFMGESRLAAAAAGSWALKPSYGLVSRFGLVGLIPSMECCALVSPCLDHIRAVLAVIAGADDADFSLPADVDVDLSPRSIDAGTVTIGVIGEAAAALPPGRVEAFGGSVDALRARGLAVRELSLPDLPLFSAVHRIVGSVEASSCLGRYDSVRYGPRAPGTRNWNEMYLQSRGAAFGTLLKSYLIQGAFYQFQRYDAFEDTCRLRARLVAEMERLTAEVDFLALPVSGAALPGDAGPASANGDAGPAGDARVAGPTNPATGVGPTSATHRTGPSRSLADLYAEHESTLFANVTGQPALYLPPEATGLMSGLQLTGPRLADGRLLALGRFLSDGEAGGGA